MGSTIDYDIPTEARNVLQAGILNHPHHHASLPPETHSFLQHLTFTGSAHPRLAVSWRFAESTSALLGLEALLLNTLLQRKYNLPPQRITIDTDHASLFIMSPYLVELNPDPTSPIEPTSLFESQSKFAQHFPNRDIHGMASTPLRGGVSNIYRAADGRFVHTHASMDPTPSLLAMGLPQDDPKVGSREECWKVMKEVIAGKTAEEWERVLGEEARQAFTVCLDVEEYRASEQGRANEGVGLYRIHHRVGMGGGGGGAGWWEDSPLTGPERPLAGLKVLDLTRVIASPTMTRGLAELGASVMRVTAPHLPDYSGLLPDLNWGKWNCSLDLRQEKDRAHLKKLLQEADVVVNGYRPGVLDKYGLGHEEVFKLGEQRGRGYIYVRENCFGWQGGPLDHRSGWQPVSDANTGVSMAYGRAMGLDEPVTPIYPASDFATGIMGTCAVLQALIEKSEKGGSFLIDTSLNYANAWLVNSVGEYPKDVWEDVWARNGKPVFRHWHNTGVILPEHLKLCAKQGLFEKKHFEIRNSGALGGLPLRMVKPVLQLPEGHVKPGFHVGTRGNGVDEPRWPADLSVEVVQ